MRRILAMVLAAAVVMMAVPGHAVAASWPVLVKGTKGADVIALQHFLVARGYSLTVDGDFGSGTETVVKSFQSDNSLTADGIVGSATWSKVVITVQRGSSGQAVYALQKQLNTKHKAGLAVDGAFGAATESAVKSFQSSHSLTADGIVGPATWQQLIGHFEELGGSSGTGWYRYLDDGNDDWGTGNTIALFRSVASQWAALGYNVRIGVGDISLEHGGYFSPHSGHQVGREMDLRPLRNDGVEGACQWNWSCYDRAKTQKLVDLLRATGDVDVIFFNDPNVTGVTPLSGHDNHLHVRFKH